MGINWSSWDVSGIYQLPTRNNGAVQPTRYVYDTWACLKIGKFLPTFQSKFGNMVITHQSLEYLLSDGPPNGTVAVTIKIIRMAMAIPRLANSSNIWPLILKRVWDGYGPYDSISNHRTDPFSPCHFWWDRIHIPKRFGGCRIVFPNLRLGPSLKRPSTVRNITWWCHLWQHQCILPFDWSGNGVIQCHILSAPPRANGHFTHAILPVWVCCHGKQHCPASASVQGVSPRNPLTGCGRRSMSIHSTFWGDSNRLHQASWS